MKKKSTIVRVILAVLAVLIIVGVIKYRPGELQEVISLDVTMSSPKAEACKVYYLKSGEENGDFNEDETEQGSYTGNGEMQTVSIEIPLDTAVIRFDPAAESCQVDISRIAVNHRGRTIFSLSLDDDVQNMVSINAVKKGDVYSLDLTSNDGYIVFHAIDPAETQAGIQRIDEEIATEPLSAGQIVLRVLVCAVVALLFFLLIWKWNAISSIPIEVVRNRKLVGSLGRNDFRNKFAGSFFGTFWAFVQPVVTIFVYWFVFQRALNVGSQVTKGGIEVPYVLWLLSGLVPWFFFSDAMGSGSNALMEYTYLVKKVVFHVSCLPVVKILSSLYVHLFFVAFTLIMYTAYGMFPGWFSFQLLYYSLALLINVTGVVYLTSAIVAFFRDMSQIVNIVLQVGVWFTPIMWNIDAMNVSGALLVILKANPMYYIVMGYRDSLINHIWFWQRPAITLYFWLVTILIFICGTHVFRRLQPHFADVL